MMKIEYDKDVDAAYIYLKYPIREGGVQKTVELNKRVMLDFGNKGKILGIELLDASLFNKSKTIQLARTLAKKETFTPKEMKEFSEKIRIAKKL